MKSEKFPREMAHNVTQRSSMVLGGNRSCGMVGELNANANKINYFVIIYGNDGSVRFRENRTRVDLPRLITDPDTDCNSTFSCCFMYQS